MPKQLQMHLIANDSNYEIYVNLNEVVVMTQRTQTKSFHLKTVNQD